jgi:hypothetical protein
VAISAACIWEVRSTGAATNGGGFVSTSSGTDYSQQDAAQVSVTDGVANGTTTLTSATAAFTDAHVGNIIYVEGGTGSITAVRKEIISRTNATTIVVDSSTGLTAGTGVTLKIGGAVDGLAILVTPIVAGNKVWVRGSLTTAATIALTDSGTDAAPIDVAGYTTTRGDGGQATITSTNSAATSVVSVTGDHWIFRNLTIDGASLSLRGLYFNTVSGGNTADNCWFKGATQYGFLNQASSNGITLTRCLATGNGTSGAHAGFGVEGYEVFFDRCVARDNAGNGFAAVNSWLNMAFCAAHDNTLSGAYIDGDNTGVKLLHSTLEGNTLDGLRVADAASMSGAIIRHNVFAGNAGYGARSLTTDYSADTRFRVMVEANAYYNNTLGARSLMPTGTDDITLTATPFMDAAADDFALNYTLGGGLSARGLALGLGLRGTLAEPSDGLVDAGAVQSGGGAGSGTALSGMRSLWRELTGEKYTSVVPDTVVDRYLQRGLNELNRRVRYHYTDSSTAITLLAGTQEYALPTDCMELIHVYWNGQELKKSDVEQWRRQYVQWRLETGEPREWAMYGDKLVLYPTPTAEAVAAEDNPVLRYVATPGEIATYGPAQLRTGDTDLAVYHGVALWSASYPDSALAQQRLATYEKLFDQEADRVAGYYEVRLVTK